MKRLLISAAALAALTTTAVAWSDQDRSELAFALGSILAAEDFCGLTFNQAAIEAFIGENVPAGDMHFSAQLWLLTNGSKESLKVMSESQLTAHCSQTRRVAAEYDLTE
ncbi:signal recognition particle [uncultured Roseibium sp.]|uniref:signal recognition particle n=1 Tax=uncultured Roseibium sp. TaxID=1936171 RepID=UPI002625661A|nr:signal recognition particle [uncultured Roseibium sp.]